MARGSVLSAARTRLSRSRRLRYIQNYYMRRTSVLVIMVLMAGALTLTGPLRADAQVSQSLGTAPSVSHSSARSPVVRSEADGVSALSGALSDSLSNAVPGATIDVDPAGTHCLGTTPVASTTTGSGGSFSVSVSPATYDVWVNYPGDSTDPAFAVCTDSVDLSASVTDALTFPVTRLTVTAQDSSGDPVQGATVLGSGQTQTLAGFDLFPGQPIYPGYSYLTPDHNFTTSAAGIAVVPLMPMTSPLTLSVAPPADSGLGGTTVNAGTMTTDTAVTATLAEPVTLSGALSDSLSNAVPGATIDVDPAGTHCLGTTPVASTTTGSGGSFSVSVSPATYDVWVNYPGDSTDPAFAVCTDSVDLSASVTDALTFPVTRLTVTAQDSSGDPVQGATVLGSGQTQTLAGFDLFPGQPIYPGYSYLTPDHNFTTSAAGIAVVPLMPMTSPLTLSVAPPADSGLGGTTVNAGTMTTDTAVTATLDGPPYHQTQTTLSTSPNPSSYGQSVTFTATVSPTDGGGTVSFTADGNPVAGCSGLALTFVSGNYEVVCITSSMAAGSHVIDAAYTGDTNYSGSSGTANESVHRNRPPRPSGQSRPLLCMVRRSHLLRQ